MSYDPVTGLTGGIAPEPDYPERCQHCPKPLRLHNGGTWTAWIDPDGLFRCQKDVDHKPLPSTS